MNGFADRIGRALKLDATLFEEVEHDKQAFIQAMAVVALSSVAAGIGGGTAFGLQGLFWTIVYAFTGWFFWAAVIYFVGSWLRNPNTSTDMGELLRVMGFASAPGIFRILGVFGLLQNVIFLITAVWMLIATVIAVRQALDFLSTGRAAAVCGLGLVLQILLAALMARIVQTLYIQ